MIRTVLGDRHRSEWGATDYHEHVFQVSPLLPGEELDNEDRSLVEVCELRSSGFEAMIDATPIGLGRRPEALARISERSQVAIVATTGGHRDAHYDQGHWILELTERQLGERFVREIRDGMATSDDGWDTGHRASRVRAGMLKAGIDYWGISEFEMRVLDAVAIAHRETNAPVMVHLESGTAAFEVLDLLLDQGVSSDSVVLAHVDRNPDPVLHRELAARGAYLGYDGFGRAKDWPDSTVIDCLIRTLDAAGADRVLVGGDVARRSRYRAYSGMPGLRYLGKRVLPRLRAEAPPGTLDRILIENPARFLDRFPHQSAVYLLHHPNEGEH